MYYVIWCRVKLSNANISMEDSKNVTLDRVSISDFVSTTAIDVLKNDTVTVSSIVADKRVNAVGEKNVTTLAFWQ